VDDLLFEETPKAALEFWKVACPAFPDHKDLPAYSLKRLHVPSVSVHIPLPLLLPEFRIRGGPDPPILTSVLVPETAMDKDYFPVARQYEIGRTRQGTLVQTESVSHTVDHPPHDELRFRILATNPRHAVSALFCCQHISHRR